MTAGYDGSIRIDSSIDPKGFNAGIKGITNSLKGVAAAVGVAFGVQRVFEFGKAAIQTASDMSTAMVGLRSILNGQGKSFQEAQGFINQYVSDGLVPATNAINAYKNLASRGYDTGQIEQTLTALKDAAAFGRQSSLTMGQAVESATSGLKQENSILVDNAGVTKNVAKMWEDYARSIGKSATALTQQEKIQAEVNGIMQESRFQTGDAARLVGTYAGQVQMLGQSFLQFKQYIGEGLIAAFSGVLPIIQKVMDFLIRGAVAFSQLMQILFGIKIQVGGAATGIEAAAGATGDLADNTKAAEKAAKGALAAFDEINVLQQDTGSGAGAGLPAGGLTGGAIIPEDNFIQTEGLLKQLFKRGQDWAAEFLNNIGGWFVQAWENIKKWAGNAWQWIWNDGADWAANTINNIGKWFAQAWENIKRSSAGAWETIKIWAGDAWQWIVEKWAGLGEWFRANVTTPISNVFASIWATVKAKAGEAWAGIVGIWNTAGTWFKNNVTDPIRNGFKGALDWVNITWQSTFTGVKNFTKNTVNSIIDFINGMIRAIASGINAVVSGLNTIRVTIPSWIPVYGGSSWGVNVPYVSAPQIPHLATGAVIPPNAAFAAVLGDQKAGRNLEAPEDLIRQIVREESGQGSQNITINFEGSMAALVRSLKPYIDKENTRVGGSLIQLKGSAA